MSETSHVPDLEAQRAALKKLDFLIGEWTGETWMLRGPGQRVDLIQTEKAEYRLNGLLLLIEGLGRSKPDGAATLQALGVVSYDDERKTYLMRAFNDGRFLETELKLLETGQGISWGFESGQYKTSSVLRINEKGQWTEQGDISVGGNPPVRFLELAVTRMHQTLS
jgi:hypothetical protein